VTLSKLVLRFRRLIRRIKLFGVSFHTLRHTFASHAVMAGVDLYTLAKILGHRDIKQVQQYAHLAPAHLQAATDQAARAVFAKEVPHQVPHAIGYAR
jgi:site-specific recombinase XerD